MRLEKAQEKLSQISPHFEVLEYVPAKKGKSKFLDKRRDKVFYYFYFPLLRRLKERPDFIPCPSPEEQRTINRNKADKITETVQRRYGVTNPSQLASVKEKKKRTTRSNLGVDYPTQSQKVLDKRVDTYQKLYGVDNPSQSAEVQKKKQKAFQKYTNGHPLKDPKIRETQLATAIKNGTVRTIKGKTVAEWAKEKGLHYQTVSQNARKYGAQSVPDLNKSYSVIESMVKSMLPEHGLVHSRQLKDTSYRPDFVLHEHRLIIECDGLYWHSDKVQTDNKYHLKKLATYESLGYRSLFFREHEIRDKGKIVSSIISNSLQTNVSRIYARKTSVGKTDPSFFTENHLMGKGAGAVFSLDYQGETVAAMQVKWRSKKKKELEISRFCTKLNTTVVGGFSKLLKAVESSLSPRSIVTFVDRRYGKGDYLKDLGFEYKGEHVSFKWTDFSTTYHRMRFPGNSGYELGLHKIWDCGQAKWVKQTS